MSSTLIMPKQTGQQDAFIASLKLFYDSFQRNESWYTNDNFKNEIQVLLPYLSEGAKDGPYLVKQSELTRYFGFAEYDYSARQTRITDSGKIFYEAFLQNDVNTQIDLLMSSILTHTFGRNNTAIKSSDSDIDPPKLFIKSMYDLGGITRKDLAYLLYITHDKKISYDDALNEFRHSSADREIFIPIEVSNKYSDVKFTCLLSSFNICIEGQDKLYRLSPDIIQRYGEKIRELSIYNTTPNIIYTLDETLIDTDTSTEENNIEQISIIKSFGYDIESDKFKKQNDRQPIPSSSSSSRYKTNPRISKTALQIADFKCMINTDVHTTFIAKSGQQYMEAHHLIPMHAQKDFPINLDRIENIVSICPTCHSAIHLGNDSVRLEFLKKLYDLKEKELKSVGLNISFGDLFTKYYK